MQDFDYYGNIPNLFSLAASLNGLYYSSFDLTTRWSYSLLISDIFQGQQLNKQQQINILVFTFFKVKTIMTEKRRFSKDYKGFTALELETPILNWSSIEAHRSRASFLTFITYKIPWQAKWFIFMANGWMISSAHRQTDKNSALNFWWLVILKLSFESCQPKPYSNHFNHNICRP